MLYKKYVKILQICDIIPLTQATVLGHKNPETNSVRGDKKYLQRYFGWRVVNILNKRAIFY